jgi:hypothetical protein
MPSVAYGCCVGSWDRFNRYVVPSAGGAPVLGLSGQTSIADAYNAMLTWAADGNFDLLILQHDDLEITDPDHVAKFAAAFAADEYTMLAGVAGGSARGGLAWWNHDPVGHQLTDAMNIDFGARAGVVDLLEGSILAFSRRGIETLGFESRPGFHGYDEIAMAATRQPGWCAVVVDVDTHHHTALGFDNEASHEDWLAADRWFRQKWSIA